MLRFMTAGESHGPGLVTIVEGLPRGLKFDLAGLDHELGRRRLGHGRGNRMKIEQDKVEVLGGVRHGRTLGSPVAIIVRNSEADKWAIPMSIEPLDDPVSRVTRPRPGHADLAGMIKYDTTDARDVLERASARETAARTVAGFLAKTLLSYVGVSVVSHVTEIGDVMSKASPMALSDFASVDDNPVRCLDGEAARAMVSEIERVQDEKDTLGGWFEVVGFGVPVGIGSYVHYDRRLDGLLAQALMSIPAIKAVEIGDGGSVARVPGSQAHDEIYADSGSVGRRTNRAGGMEGGTSNGEPIRVSAAMKPISTLMQPLDTVDMDDLSPAAAVRERSDVCAVPAAAVVGEQMMAWVLADEMTRQFGGDTVDDFTGAHQRYLERIAERLQT